MLIALMKWAFFNKQNKKNCIRMTHQWYRCRVWALQCKAFTGFSFSFFLMFLSLGIAKTMTTALSLSSSLFPPLLYPITYKWVTSLLLWLLWIWTLRTKGYFSYTRGFLVFFFKTYLCLAGCNSSGCRNSFFQKHLLPRSSFWEKRHCSLCSWGLQNLLLVLVHSCSLIKKKYSTPCISYHNTRRALLTSPPPFSNLIFLFSCLHQSSVAQSLQLNC